MSRNESRSRFVRKLPSARSPWDPAGCFELSPRRWGWRRMTAGSEWVGFELRISLDCLATQSFCQSCPLGSLDLDECFRRESGNFDDSDISLEFSDITSRISISIFGSFGHCSSSIIPMFKPELRILYRQIPRSTCSRLNCLDPHTSGPPGTSGRYEKTSQTLVYAFLRR